MNLETRQCQNCKESFSVEPADFEFYKKISVPPPTWCPECRMIRRMTHRNERSLYRDTCGKCKKNLVSMYAPESPYIRYCKECWYSDQWEATEYGRAYDFNKPFFEQWKELMLAVPRLALMHIRDALNSDFGNYLGMDKNVYLGFSVIRCENIMYSRVVDDSRDCNDCYAIGECELCYNCIESSFLNRCQYAFRVGESINCAFLYDANNCQDCFMSVGLRNKRYVFRNQQLTKEQYQEEMSKIDLSSRLQIEALKKEFDAMRLNFIQKYANILQSQDCSGDGVINAKNVKRSYDSYSSEDLKYCVRCVEAKDSYDLQGQLGGEMCYESVAAGSDGSLVRFASVGDNQRDTHYTDMCFQSHDLFGCVGLRHKSYAILNTVYSKEEYDSLKTKIIAQMRAAPYRDAERREYRYGELFPSELSPFAYNETIAQEHFPLTKEEAIAKGFRWRDEDVKDFGITMKYDEIPDRLADVTDEITKQIIECRHQGMCNEKCTTAFRVTPNELQFYRQMNVPIPDMCPNCRHFERLGRRNPYKTWQGKCMCAGAQSDPSATTGHVFQNTATTHSPHESGQHCQNTFETPYKAGGPYIVYCEACYQSEII